MDTNTDISTSSATGMPGIVFTDAAARKVQEWAALELGLPALMSFVHPDNVASRKVAERLGAQCEGNTELRGSPRLFMRHVLPTVAQAHEPIEI